jgi:hypothetical protein
MRLRLGLSLVAVIAMSAAAGAAVVLAGGGNDGPGQAREPAELSKVRAHIVGSPPVASAARAAGIAARAVRRKRKPALVYLETEPQSIAAGPTGFRVGSCPKRAKAINGYYYMAGTQTSFGLDAQGDSPVRGLRQWAFYLDSVGGASNVTFGLICLKNVG